jgi:dTDP-L-rhamnose 4-epimerase
MKVLVTGGAGFIGSHLVKALVRRGHQVTILDALVPQVHGPNPQWPDHLPGGVTLLRGNVTDVSAWQQALHGADIVYHLAAEVGVGQSMYEIVRYMNANTLGTSILWELLAAGTYRPQKVIVASSMSIYGEGAYQCPSCGPVAPRLRSEEQLERRQWEVLCSRCGAQLRPIPTDEDKPLQPTSVYAISKRDQEELSLSIGRAYNIPTVALRFFNAYGPGQSLSNPYTGAAAIFCSRLLNQKQPLIFEDGCQSRDFIHVSDIVQGLLLALERDEANYQAFNLGTGIQHTILDIAMMLAKGLNLDIQPDIVNKYRAGDIRHCYADIAKARRLLGFEPQVSFDDGVPDLAQWVRSQTATDLVEQARVELEKRGLAR